MEQFICPYCFNKFNSYIPGWTGRLFGVRTSVKDKCPTCGTKFPRGLTSLSSVMIAIIGDKDTGKSNYISVLIYRIKELYQQFGWSLIAIDDETEKLYNRVFYKPLYGHNGIAYTVKATQQAELNQDVKQPLLYTLGMSYRNKYSFRHKYKVITLAFFDTAGEDLRNQGDVNEEFYRYIYNSSGIIMLVDPTGIKGLRAKAGLKETTAASSDEMRKVFERIARIIQVEKYKSLAARIDIPFAITLSKIDIFRENNILNETNIFKKSKHKGYVDMSEIDSISSDIMGCISEYDTILLNATQSFKNVRFFGVSALGEDPKEDPRTHAKPLVESTRPDPIRVEDPFLWILSENNFIKTRRSNVKR